MKKGVFFLLFWLTAILVLLNSGKFAAITGPLDSATFLMFVYVPTVFVFTIPSRVHITIVLMFLILIPFMLYLSYEKTAEILSTIIYYLLILIVFQEVLLSIFKKNDQ